MLQVLSGYFLAYDPDSRELIVCKGSSVGDYTIIGPAIQQVTIADLAGDELGVTDDGKLPVETDDQAADEKVWAQLTAAGSTPWHEVRDGVKNHLFQVTLAAKDTSVTVKCEGSQDGTNAFNLNAAGATTTWTANGTYPFTKANCPCKFVRFTFSSEVGGANATLDARWSGTE